MNNLFYHHLLESGVDTDHIIRYLRDITKRNRVKNIGELEDLLNILSSAIGSLTNPEKLKNTFKTVKKSRITSATIKKIWIILRILS